MKVTETYCIRYENMEIKCLNGSKKWKDEIGGSGVRKTEE
jgi:hypothetical protein